MSTEERFDMERQYHDAESPLARLSGRLKSACCRECGSADGMKSAHRETLVGIPRTIEGGEIVARWHRDPGNDEYLFHPCLSCNRDRIIPAGFILMTADEVLAWLDTDPMAPDYEAQGQDDYSKLDWGEDPREMEPDYAALAAEEPVLASQDGRESAGL